MIRETFGTKLRNNRTYVYFLKNILGFQVVIYFLLLQYNYRPARDDWNNWSNLRNLSIFSLDSWQLILTNQWCCTHEKRVFFLSWLIQWPITKMGQVTPFVMLLVMFLFILSILVSSFNIMKHFVGDSNFLAISTMSVAFSPTIIVVGLWANNMFFLIPTAFSLAIFRELLHNPLSKLKVTSLTFLSIFSGESALVVTLVLLLFYFIHTGKEHFRFLVLLLFASVISVFLYREFVAVGPKTRFVNIGFSQSVEYFKGFYGQFNSLHSFIDGPYASRFEFNPVFFLFLLLNILIVFVFVSNIKHNSRVIYEKFNLLVFALFTCLYFSTLIPLLIGSWTGIRGGSDYRYHLSPTIFLLIGLFILISRLKNLFSIYILSSLILIVSILLSGAALSTKSQQAELDRQLWAKIDALSKTKPDLIVTYNPSTSYPMPPYFSFAESDFQADWGIAGYYSWRDNYRPLVAKRISCSQFDCRVELYYGDFIIKSKSILNSTIFVLSKKEIKPKSLSINDFVITKDYNLYLDFISKYPAE